MTTVLVDGDIVAYRCAAVNENADAGLAVWQADQFIARILEDVNADNWKIYLSGENNFRYRIFPEYKANRRNVPKPRHLERVREYLVCEHNAIIADGREADDELGIAGTRGLHAGVIIASSDKDLLQVPGTHYNFVRRELRTITPLEGLRNLYGQLLIGDATDNIRGCPGIGKAKAPRILEGCCTESDFVEQTWKAFEQAGCSERDYIIAAQLLYVLRKEDLFWSPPLDADIHGN